MVGLGKLITGKIYILYFYGLKCWIIILIRIRFKDMLEFASW